MRRTLAPLLLLLAAACAGRRTDSATPAPAWLSGPLGEVAQASAPFCGHLRDSLPRTGDSLFLHTEVDRPATIVTPGRPASYPDRAGQAAVAFVVDTIGRPEPRSKRLIWASDGDIGKWALAMADGIYAPAEWGGRSVRQCLVVPFTVNFASRPPG